MTLIRKILLAGFMASSIVGAAQAEEKVIRFGSDATYAPFEYMNAEGEVIGFDIDIAKAMCEKMKAKCTFQNQAWDGIIPALRAKKFDVIASSMSITPERQKAVAFTKMIWNSPNPLVGKKGTTAQPTLEGTKGKVVGVQQATIQDRYATKYFKDATIKRYKTFDDALNDLVLGRVELVFCDVGVGDEFLKSSKGKDFDFIGDAVLSIDDPEIFGVGTGFAVRKQDTELLEALNKAFDEVRADGTYDKIQKQYFKVDMYQ